MARRRKYPGHVAKRGNSYRVTLSVNGRRHRFTVKTTDRERAEAEAEAEYKRLEKEAERRELGLPTAMRVSELLDAYETDKLPRLSANTRKTYQRSIDRFREFFTKELPDPHASKVRPAHVRRFLSWRERKDSVGARTLAKDRATLSGVFTFAAKELEIVDANPVQAVDPPKADTRDPVILSEAEYDALLEAADDDMLRLYILVLGETGARSGSEALWLRWEDVDLEEGFLWIHSGKEHRTKSGKGRWTPMTRRLREAMRAHFAKYRFRTYRSKRTEWVFHHRYNRRRAKAGERVGNLRRGFEAARERAAESLEKDGTTRTRLREVHQHDLRHRRVTKWLAEGADAVKVKEAVGHSDLRTTMGYTHLAREHLRSLVEEPSRGADLREVSSRR